MVLAVINKLMRLDLMGALKVKYFGLSFGLLLILYIVAYAMNIAGIRDRMRIRMLDNLVSRFGFGGA